VLPTSEARAGRAREREDASSEDAPVPA
jgi:hypothetical protein